ncbi:MAG: hypothetical protein BIFFINMI_02453 [Phycisphaerae bacterium]|nr:hypothetical protein [Phycisphaerae bacterium]
MTPATRSFFEAVLSIFAIVNPIGTLPVFAGMTEGMSPPLRRRVFRLAGLVAFCIIAIMAVTGRFIIDQVFHITLDEFALGGGLLLIVVGIYQMIVGLARHTGPPLDADQGARLAVTPLASPLLVGPGTIVTVMLIVSRHGPLYGLSASVVAFVFVMLVLHFSHHILKLMGRVGSIAVGRVMQIFIISIGVHFVVMALKRIFPLLAP